jgi:hypothetical protein
MLEILLIFYAVQRIVKLAGEKGLPKTWALLAVLIPVSGVVTMLVVSVVFVLTGIVPQDYSTLAALPFYLGAEVATALLIINFVKNRPAGPLPIVTSWAGAAQVPVVPAMPAAATGEGLAGYCAECGANKWLAADGSCPEGHPASSVSNVYSAPRTVS